MTTSSATASTNDGTDQEEQPPRQQLDTSSHGREDDDDSTHLSCGRTAFLLSVLVAALCLVPVYKDEVLRFIQQQQPTYSQHGQGVEMEMEMEMDTSIELDPSQANNGTAASADRPYQTAPFDIPIAPIECRPCSEPELSHLLNPLAPHAVIGGAMKGGTRALLTYLSQHPDVYSEQGAEMHLLDNANKNIKLFHHRDSPICDQCEVLDAYRKLYKERRRKNERMDHSGNKSNRTNELIFFDKSPSYMVMSHILPQRIACTFSERTKVVFVLRNPVDRAYSHFQHCVLKHRNKKVRNDECGGSFEQYVDKDYHGLEVAGVFNASSPIEEYESWLRYHRGKGSSRNFVLAKSLYAITLRHWIAVFRQHFGFDDLIGNKMLILESEWMREHKQEALDETLYFLNLPQYRFQTDEEYHVGSYQPMSDHMRKRLVRLFRPFNARLHEMLSPFGIEISWAKEDASILAR